MQFHFILTVTWPIAKGIETNTFEGTITSRPGQTRRDLYKAVRQHALSTSSSAARPKLKRPKRPSPSQICASPRSSFAGSSRT